MLSKAQAAKELMEHFKQAAPELRELLRNELEALVVTAETNGSWQAQRASSVAGNCLDQLEAIDIAQQKPPCPYGSWKDTDMTRAQRFSWLQLDILVTFGFAVRVDVRSGPGRNGWVEREACAVLSAPDPLAAADAWLDEHWDPDTLRSPADDTAEPEADEFDPVSP